VTGSDGDCMNKDTQSNTSRRAFVAGSVGMTTILASEGTRAMSTAHQVDSTPVARPTVLGSVDFSQGADYPLIKSKFAIFNSGIVPADTYERDAAQFGVVRPESLRIDLAWGTDWAGWASQPIQGTASDLAYDFGEMDRIAATVNQHGCLPYWSYCYNPTPLQEPLGNWRGAPSDMAAWGRVLRDVAAHYREMQATNPAGYHEVYNEPDNSDFFVGTMTDYFAMYEHGSLGIREGDPEALVGGPALAFTKDWIGPFIDFVAERKLPFDFFSTHIYGTGDLFQGLTAMLDVTRDSLDRHPELATVETHLNEFNSYVIDYPLDGTQQKHRLAAAFLRDMAFLLERPELTLVHWAQFLDSGQDNYSGMVSIDGHRKAVFNAAEIYARLPTDRSAVMLAGPTDLGAIAATNEHRAGVALWNLTRRPQEVALDLSGFPFTDGDLTEYRIDAEHASWGDGTATEALTSTGSQTLTPDGSLRWSGTVPTGGVLYLEANDATGQTAPDVNPVARWRRTLRYYPDRKTTAYADFDKTTWTFRLGMANEPAANAQVGVTAEDLPDEMSVSVTLEGTVQSLTPESLLGLRVDYRTGDAYTSSVLIHGPGDQQIDPFDENRISTTPWGTLQPPTQIITVPDLGHFSLALRDRAPEGWDGRAQITAIMTDTGPGTRARIRLAAG